MKWDNTTNTSPNSPVHSTTSGALDYNDYNDNVQNDFQIKMGAPKLDVFFLSHAETSELWDNTCSLMLLYGTRNTLQPLTTLPLETSWIFWYIICWGWTPCPLTSPLTSHIPYMFLHHLILKILFFVSYSPHLSCLLLPWSALSCV